MDTQGPLKDKMILVIDDEANILDTVKEELDMCQVHKATNYDMATQNLFS